MRLRGGDLTPSKAAFSVALGLLVGTTPLPGAHFWIILAIGLFFRLDVPIAYLVANISIPPLMVLIALGEIEIGSFLRTGSFIGLAKEELAARGVGTYLKDVALGTAVVAPTAAAIGGTLTYAIARLRERHRAERSHAHDTSGASFSEVVHRVTERYRDAPMGTGMYVSSKLSSDPVAEALMSVAERDGDLGAVLDVGCGRGQFSLLLLEAHKATRAVGVDWDEEKIAQANRAAAGLDAQFAQGDLRTAPFESSDTVLLFDVLHYFAHDEQSAILNRAASAANRRVVIRDVDPDRGWRSTLTRLQERITTGARYNRGERVSPRSIAHVRADLEALGFDVEVSPCWRGTPFANVLVVGRK